MNTLNALAATRYLTISGLVALLWDHLLTLDEEIRVIWTCRGRSGILPKLLFAFNRYGSEITLLFITYVTSGLRDNLTDSMCRGFVIVAGSAAALAVATSNFIILIRVYALWDHRKGIASALIGGFCLAMTATLVFEVLALRDLQSHIFFSISLNTCAVEQKPRFIVGPWAALSTFDLYIIMLTVFNALDRPHQTHIEVIDNLHRDGARIFLTLFALRFLNLLISAFGGAAEILIVVFISWALFSIMNSRLHLRIEALKLTHMERFNYELTFRG